MHRSPINRSQSDGEQPPGLRVLVVEDNRVMADVMGFNFDRAGFAVTVALNGRIAWDLLQTETFQLLVTDFQMPEMDGGELCRRIRSDSRFADLPIILLTAKGLEIDRERLTRELGLSLVLYKPFSPRQLIAAAEEFVAGKMDTVSPPGE
ncbi:MAG TPA: response regulator [Planctomycetaceae bacterium]|jgi:CheY-like chemotaxis protein